MTYDKSNSINVRLNDKRNVRSLFICDLCMFHAKEPKVYTTFSSTSTFNFIMDRLLIYDKSSRTDEETEEDRKILSEQEKFMKKLKENNIQPAAKIVRLNDEKKTIGSHDMVNLYKFLKYRYPNLLVFILLRISHSIVSKNFKVIVLFSFYPESTAAEETHDDVLENIVNTFEYIPKNAIVKPIVEKRKNEDNCYNIPSLSCNSYGFPKAKRRDVS